MSGGDVTPGYLKRLSYVPEDSTPNGLLIAGQNYYNVYFTGGTINGVNVGGTNPGSGTFTTVEVTGSNPTNTGIFANAVGAQLGVGIGYKAVAYFTPAGQSTRQLYLASGAVGIDPYISTTAGNLGLRAGSGNVFVGYQALATNATTGFLCVPSGPGAPTGIPVIPYAGAIPQYIDTTNNKVWYYINNAWKSTQLT